KEQAARDESQGASNPAAIAADKSMREILVTEHYKVMDYEENGKPALYRVTTAGDKGEILRRDGKPDIVPVDMIPFAATTPVINTHRFFGRSLADLVLDLQKIKTALLRALLDSAWLANNQRMQVSMDDAGPRALEDLLVNRNQVRVKKIGGIAPIPTQDISQQI